MSNRRVYIILELIVNLFYFHDFVFLCVIMHLGQVSIEKRLYLNGLLGKIKFKHEVNLRSLTTMISETASRIKSNTRGNN